MGTFVLYRRGSSSLPNDVVSDAVGNMFSVSPGPLMEHNVSLSRLSKVKLAFTPVYTISSFFLFETFGADVF